MNLNPSSLSSNECIRHQTRCTHVFEYVPRTSPHLPAHCLKSKWYTTFLFLSFLGISSTHAAQVKTMDELRAIDVSISGQDLTRITVKEDRILNVFGNTGDYVLETDDSQGQIFIRPTQQDNKKPFSLTLTTEKGRIQDLRLIPNDQAAEAIVLKPTEDMNERLKEKRALISRGEVESLFEACRAGRIPLGYKQAPLNLHTFQDPYKLIQELKGDTLRCLTYEVTNSLPSLEDEDENKKQLLRLSESQFAGSLPFQKHDIIAVLISKHTLHPGERTYVYVVARTY